MAYPDSVDDLTTGIPSDGIAGATPLGSVTYPHDDHHRDLGVAVEAIETQILGEWSTYTPDLYAMASAATVTLGTGSAATGYYKRLGRIVIGYALIQFGTSGVSAGTGIYGLLLPVEPANRDQPVGTGYVMDSSANYHVRVGSAAVSTSIYASSTSRAIILVTNAAGEGFSTADNPVGAGSPWTWDTSDYISMNFQYEAAAAS